MKLTTSEILTESPFHRYIKETLLYLGILSSLIYAAMNIFIPMQWQDYSIVTQTVSELSAIGAPTRPVWVFWGMVYTLLMFAFGWGICMSANRNRPLRIVGTLLIIYGFIGLFWPPMHLRGTVFDLTDTLHIVFSLLTVLLMLFSMGFGAASLGKGFRIYSIITIIIAIVFGVLTGNEAPHVAPDQPTPLIGIWERINIGVFLLWIIVFAIILLRKQSAGHLITVSNDSGT